MALLSYNAAYREKLYFFSFPPASLPALPSSSFRIQTSEFGEHMSEHFYILAAPFPSSASQLNLQNQPPPRQSSKITNAVRARMEKCASK